MLFTTVRVATSQGETSMKTQQNFLDAIDIATPCDASWEGMPGDDQMRFCGLCELNVYNLSGMSREEAQQVILEKEGKVCVRFLRRVDGTVLTQDCPVGLAKIRQKICNGFVRGAALLCFVFTTLVGCGSKANNDAGKATKPTVPQVTKTPLEWMGEAVVPMDGESPERMLGKLAMPHSVKLPGSKK